MLSRIVQFVSLFSLMLAIFLYFYTQDDQADFKRLSFSNTQINSYCENLRENYQECLRQDLHSIISISTPVQVSKISSLIYSVYGMDLLRLKEGSDKVKVSLYLVKNYTIFLNEVADFSFDRNQLDLFQIFLFPYVRSVIQSDLEKIQESVKFLEKDESLDEIQQNEVRRLLKANVGLFRDVLW